MEVLKPYVHVLQPSGVQEAQICCTFPSVSWMVLLSNEQLDDMQVSKLCIMAGNVQMQSY
jgi:hypothetical protein